MSASRVVICTVQLEPTVEYRRSAYIGKIKNAGLEKTNTNKRS